MTNSSHLARPVLVSIILAGVALLSSGCGSEEGIQSYRVPREAGEYRILGTMYPADDPAWFFKLTGPTDEVAKYEADFDKLAASVQVKDDATVPVFTLPAGWTRGGPKSLHAETIKLPGSLEVTITASKGGVESNIARWVEQVGHTGGPAKTRTFDAIGGKGLRVDVTGPKKPTGGPMMGRAK